MQLIWESVHAWFSKNFRQRRTHVESQNRDLIEELNQRLKRCEQRHEEDEDRIAANDKRIARLEDEVDRFKAERAIGVIECDQNKRIVAWNKGAERIFRWSEQQVLGRHINIILRPKYRKRGEELFDGVSADDSTMFGLNKDGDTMALRISVVKYVLGSGEERAVLEVSIKRA